MLKGLERFRGLGLVLREKTKKGLAAFDVGPKSWEQDVAGSYCILVRQTNVALDARLRGDCDTEYLGREIQRRLLNVALSIMEVDQEQGWTRSLPEHVQIGWREQVFYFSTLNGELMGADSDLLSKNRPRPNEDDIVNREIWTADQSLVLQVAREMIGCLPPSNADRIFADSV